MREIEELRRLKIEEGIKELDGEYLQCNNLGRAEIEENREFLTRGFDIINGLN